MAKEKVVKTSASKSADDPALSSRPATDGAPEADLPSQEARKANKEARRAKKAERKTSRSEVDGVRKTKSSPKETEDERKKEKKRKSREKALLAEKSTPAGEAVEMEVDAEGQEKETAVDVDTSMTDDAATKIKKKTSRASMTTRPVGALVPFANPLADEQVSIKVLKAVKKAAACKSLKRGVKEVVKALRKSPSNPYAINKTPGSSSSEPPSSSPPGVVVLAADISPMDVISHIPVLCEDHGIPYIYVTSRAALGLASQTKRPTSVVMITAASTITSAGGVRGSGQGKGKAAKTKTDAEAAAPDGKSTGPPSDKQKPTVTPSEWKETYDGIVRLVEREGRRVRI